MVFLGRRREFITLLGGAAAWPLAARALQGKRPTIGFLGSGTAATQSQWTGAFVQRLRELGWSEGRDVAIEYRWAEGRNERAAEIAAEFVRLKVDVIVTYGTQSILAAKQATTIIPIVFALTGDPVATGLVASLGRPGGNLTGLSSQAADLGAKRLEILREAVPGLRRLAIMGNAGNPANVLDMARVHEAARILGLDAAIFEIRRTEDILARLPTMHGSRDYVEAGGLMSYGVNFTDQFRRAAGYVDRILRGAKPADLAVEQPTKFDLVINLKTAKVLGLTIPESFLLRADEVIE